MFERFTRDARAIVTQAHAEALEIGSPTVEAEHLLLALARRGTPALAGAGLDHAGVREALEAEFAQALLVAGITWDTPLRGQAGVATGLRFGSSSKLALERSFRAALERGDRRVGAVHVLLGVLRADVGTVPRALAFAGVDRAALVRSLQAG